MSRPPCGDEIFGRREDATPSQLLALWNCFPGWAQSANPYMFSVMSDFSFVLHSLCVPPLGGLWNEGERSEPSGTTRQGVGGSGINVRFGHLAPASFKSRVVSPFMLSLPRQGTTAGAPAQGVPAVCASSFNPRTAFGRSVAQLEPRTPSALNSNRCLNCGSRRRFACIRRS